MIKLHAGRRAFLQLAGATLVAGFSSGCSVPVIPGRPEPTIEDALGWIVFDGARFHLIMPRVEMGQNIGNAFRHIACIELGVGPERITVHSPDTDRIHPVRATVGSDSMRDFSMPLARACALLRVALDRGLDQPQVAMLDPSTVDPRWWAHAPSRTIPLSDGPAIVRGAPLFAGDVRLPGMLYGRVLYADCSPELSSAPLEADDAAARRVPGHVAIVRHPLLVQGRAVGIGLVARTPGALARMEAALRVRWSHPPEIAADAVDKLVDIDRRLARSERRSHAVLDETLPDGAWDLNLRIDVPLAAHGGIEPRVAVAAPRSHDVLELWVGSQDPFYQREVIRRRLGLAKEKVRVHALRIGGGFGSRTICTVELEAALLARTVGAPVKVQWNRAQELRQGFHRPPSSHRIRVRMRDGRMQAWWHSFVSSHILLTNAAAPPWLQMASRFMGDSGVARGARVPYLVPARRSEFDLVRLPVLTGPWRGLGAGPNGFAVESAVDECARRCGTDPLAFRLAHLPESPLKDVLLAVAERSRWSPAVRRTPWVGHGLACGLYKEASAVAVVVRIALDPHTGQVRVQALWCAHVCGRIADADQVKAQCEGNMVWGISMALFDRLEVGPVGVTARSFADAPIPRCGDVPDMDIHLLDSADAPGGAGETGIVAAAAAIANAVRDACGFRATRLPLQAAQLLAHVRDG